MSPHEPIRDRRLPALPARIVEEIAHRVPTEVEIVTLPLQGSVNVLGVAIRPFRQQHNVFAICTVPLATPRLDHDGAIETGLLLEPRMTVIPVGARLIDSEAIDVGLARPDAVEAQSRHAVHIGGENDSVPMDGARCGQPIGHSQCDGIPFAPPQQRRRESSVHGRGDSRLAGKIHRQCANFQVEFSPGQDGTYVACGCRGSSCSPSKATRTAEDQDTAGETLNKAPS